MEALQCPGRGFLAAQQLLQFMGIGNGLHHGRLGLQIADHMAVEMIGQPGGNIGRIAARSTAQGDGLLDGRRIDHVARLVGAGSASWLTLAHQNFHHGLRPDAAAAF